MSNYADCVIHLLNATPIQDMIVDKRFLAGGGFVDKQYERSFEWAENGSARVLMMVANWVNTEEVHDWFDNLPWEEDDHAVLSTTNDYVTQISTVVDGTATRHRAVNV